jgi:hypothetical protein
VLRLPRLSAIIDQPQQTTDVRSSDRTPDDSLGHYPEMISRQLGFAISVAAPVLLLSGPIPAADGIATCVARRALSRAISPDNAWIATVYDNVCSSCPLTTCDFVVETVEVTLPNEDPSPIPSTGTVFTMTPDTYQVEKPPSVSWTGRRTLEITIPNLTWAGKQETAYADLNVTYVYVPDDPVGRACVKEWFDEMTRRMQFPSESIPEFLAKCRDRRNVR